MKNDPFAIAQRAINKAFDKVNTATGGEADPDLSLYSTLKPTHFGELMKVYGEGPIVKYIQDMEAKKIMNNRGGY